MTDVKKAPTIRAPRGTDLTCKGWHQEAAMRMLMNNLDPEVAERPEDLVVYGGTGKAARSWPTACNSRECRAPEGKQSKNVRARCQFEIKKFLLDFSSADGFQIAVADQLRNFFDVGRWRTVVAERWHEVAHARVHAPK